MKLVNIIWYTTKADQPHYYNVVYICQSDFCPLLLDFSNGLPALLVQIRLTAVSIEYIHFVYELTCQKKPKDDKLIIHQVQKWIDICHFYVLDIIE